MRKLLLALGAVTGCSPAVADPVTLVTIGAAAAAQAFPAYAAAAFFVSVGAPAIGHDRRRRAPK